MRPPRASSDQAERIETFLAVSSRGLTLKALSTLRMFLYMNPEMGARSLAAYEDTGTVALETQSTSDSRNTIHIPIYR